MREAEQLPAQDSQEVREQIAFPPNPLRRHSKEASGSSELKSTPGALCSAPGLFKALQFVCGWPFKDSSRPGKPHPGELVSLF